MEAEVLLPQSQMHPTSLYSEPYRHSPYPHPTFLRPILILSSYLHMGLLSGLLPAGILTKTLYTTLLSPIHATFPAHLLLLDVITRASALLYIFPERSE